MMRDAVWNVLRGSRLVVGLGMLAMSGGCHNTPKVGAGIHGATTVSTGSATEPDSYVYYPAYAVYYNTTRHQYVYREGRSWVDRPDLPPALASSLSTTPKVTMDFHDAPENHHATVSRDYPRTWNAESFGAKSIDRTF